jgi:hypothetical protein
MQFGVFHYIIHVCFPIAMRVYNGDCVLHKNESRQVRAELRHDYFTRHRSDLPPQFCRSDILKNSVNNMGVKLYKKLPNHL